LCNPSEIRVRNETDVDFKDVIVGGEHYGDIKHGATTDYKHWKLAYDISSYSLTAGAEPIEARLYDVFGLKPLGEGHFTYVFLFKDGHLRMGAEKDDE